MMLYQRCSSVAASRNGHFYAGLVPQSFSCVVAEEDKGFCLEAARHSWRCPEMPYRWSLPLPLSRDRGGAELL